MSTIFIIHMSFLILEWPTPIANVLFDYDYYIVSTFA
jgi:hypothetical protein